MAIRRDPTLSTGKADYMRLYHMSKASHASSIPLNLGSHTKRVYVHDHAAGVCIPFLFTGILVFM